MSLMDSLIKIIEAELEKTTTTATDFARKAGITRQYLYKLLRRECDPTLPLAARIAEICGARLEIRGRGKKSA